MDVNDIRQKYLNFFTSGGRGHVDIPSAPLVPENDPTTLFTGSGMQPLLPYLLGEEHPKGTRLVDSQKCFRAEDIDEVGDNRHTTFFEMLGNWSLGDYFKKEQLPWFFTFLTEELGIDPNRLYVTVFAGDENAGISRDEESVEIWKELFSKKGITAETAEMFTEEKGSARGMHEGERIFYYDASKNWWSRAGAPEDMPAGEPGGPDSEVFFDFGTEHDPAFGEHCHPNCDCGRFLEIGNSVFMEYLKNEDGTFANLPQKNVDFGGGLERITAAVNDTPDVFYVDTFRSIISGVEQATGKAYDADVETKRSFRIVADHLRGAVFMLADGVTPSNSEAGYIARRLLRRSVQHIDALGAHSDTLHTLVSGVIDSYKAAYPELSERADTITEAIQAEESKFRKTLSNGLKELHKLVELVDRQLTLKEGPSQSNRHREQMISGSDLFDVFSTHGFPVELSIEEINRIMVEDLGFAEGLSETQIRALKQEFQEQMEEHRRRSREGAGQKFKGGLADHSDMSIKYHTATHLLHQALRDVLGDDVYQKGSNITPERLRFDFRFDRKMTDEEKKQVEDIVNEKIQAELAVWHEDVSQEEADERGAIGLFDDKYEDTVRIHMIGKNVDDIYSIEYCGGPHVSNTRELDGTFTIKKEEGVAEGVRRIKAVIQ